MTFTIRTTILAAAAALAVAPAFAKGHDQSGTSEPGTSVGAETVGPAQGLGAALGSGQDKSGKERGDSATAGKPD